ncbi:hypothetical protein Purlil1_13260 [Purpureocillium lilacinum]|uniref:Uncharacterized protein n=1 Tax=Purpureocillium lilacinum TaxID=33203 RepID=A0ABR0BER9_PURLI|nr:hypothetical protein Purlil1_13260 [Purpureocillium lilacinum]
MPDVVTVVSHISRAIPPTAIIVRGESRMRDNTSYLPAASPCAPAALCHGRFYALGCMLRGFSAHTSNVTGWLAAGHRIRQKSSGPAFCTGYISAHKASCLAQTISLTDLRTRTNTTGQPNRAGRSRGTTRVAHDLSVHYDCFARRSDSALWASLVCASRSSALVLMPGAHQVSGYLPRWNGAMCLQQGGRVTRRNVSSQWDATYVVLMNGARHVG